MQQELTLEAGKPLKYWKQRSKETTALFIFFPWAIIRGGAGENSNCLKVKNLDIQKRVPHLHP